MAVPRSEVMRSGFAEYTERFRRSTVKNIGGIAASGSVALGSELIPHSPNLTAIGILTGGFFAMRLLRDWQGSDEYKRAIKIQDHIELYRDSLPKFDLRYKLPTTISMMKQDARQHQHDSGGCNTKQSQILRGLVNALDDCELDGTVRPVAYMLDTNRHFIATPRDPNAQEESVLIMGRLLDIYMPTNSETEGQGVASDGWTDYLRTYANDEQVAGDVNKLWSQTP